MKERMSELFVGIRRSSARERRNKTSFVTREENQINGSIPHEARAGRWRLSTSNQRKVKTKAEHNVSLTFRMPC